MWEVMVPTEVAYLNMIKRVWTVQNFLLALTIDSLLFGEIEARLWLDNETVRADQTWGKQAFVLLTTIRLSLKNFVVRV